MKNIPAYTFRVYDDSKYRPKIKSVTIGTGVTSIGEEAFNGCTGLTKINWNAENVDDFSYSDEVFFDAGTAGDGIDVVFGDDVKIIPAYAFFESYSEYRPKIKSVTIGNSVTSIGYYAFRDCDDLTSVSIGNSVTSVGKEAFPHKYSYLGYIYCGGLEPTSGKIIGLPVNTVKSFCSRHPIRDDESLELKGLCRNCRTPIEQTPHKRKKLFCSDSCRMAWWNAHPEKVKCKAYYTLTCRCCGKQFESYGNIHRQFCSRSCYAQFRKKEEADE